MSVLQARRALRGGWTFSPCQVSGLRLWLDASMIAGLVDGDQVAAWYDLSGAGNHAAQADPAARPLYKTGILNGRPVVRFDGSDDYLQTAAFSAALSQPTTVVVVGSFGASGDTLYDGLAVGARHNLVRSGATTLGISAGTYLSYTDATPTGTSVWSAVFNGGSSQLWRDGTSKASGAAGAHQLTGLTLGADYRAPAAADNLLGDIAEILIYNASLSTADRQRIERYLGAKYGIAVA